MPLAKALIIDCDSVLKIPIPVMFNPPDTSFRSPTNSRRSAYLDLAPPYCSLSEEAPRR